MACGPTPGLPNFSLACAFLTEQLSIAFVQKISQVFLQANTLRPSDDRRKAEDARIRSRFLFRYSQGSDLVDGLFWTRGEMTRSCKWLTYWRPVRQSNPCRRREREAAYCNLTELCGMDSTLPYLKDSNSHWTLNGRAALAVPPHLPTGLTITFTLWMTTSDNRIRVSACKPQLVAIKDAHLNGIATAQIDALGIISQVKRNRHLPACWLDRPFRNGD